MTDFLYLVPLALLLGALGLGAFLWSLSSGQYVDLEGAAERILFDGDDCPECSTGRPNEGDAKDGREKPRALNA